MDKRVPCVSCGELVLPSTARDTGGLCVPCKRGTRDEIEAAKVRRALERSHERSPQRKHWHWLVQQAALPVGIAVLSRENQSYFAACLVDIEVHGGGFSQYFFNGAADHYELACVGLQEMGATEGLGILGRAKAILFGDELVPSSTDARRARLRIASSPNALAQPADAAIALLDASWCRDPDNLDSLKWRFAERHRLYDGF